MKQQTVQYQDVIDSLVAQVGELSQKLALAEARILAFTREAQEAQVEQAPDAGDPPHEESTSD